MRSFPAMFYALRLQLPSRRALTATPVHWCASQCGRNERTNMLCVCGMWPMSCCVIVRKLVDKKMPQNRAIAPKRM